jgi:hypothetical protein
VYRYTSPTCVFRKFADDMSHCPSKVNNEEMHCRGLFISAHQSKQINEKIHCHGLLKISDQ